MIINPGLAWPHAWGVEDISDFLIYFLKKKKKAST